MSNFYEQKHLFPIQLYLSISYLAFSYVKTWIIPVSFTNSSRFQVRWTPKRVSLSRLNYRWDARTNKWRHPSLTASFFSTENMNGFRPILWMELCRHIQIIDPPASFWHLLSSLSNPLGRSKLCTTSTHTTVRGFVKLANHPEPHYVTIYNKAFEGPCAISKHDGVSVLWEVHSRIAWKTAS